MTRISLVALGLAVLTSCVEDRVWRCAESCEHNGGRMASFTQDRDGHRCQCQPTTTDTGSD